MEDIYFCLYDDVIICVILSVFFIEHLQNFETESTKNKDDLQKQFINI